MGLGPIKLAQMQRAAKEEFARKIAEKPPANEFEARMREFAPDIFAAGWRQCVIDLNKMRVSRM